MEAETRKKTRSRSIGALLLIDLQEKLPGGGHVPKQQIIQQLENHTEVEEITEVQAVGFDLMLRARFRTLRHLSQFIEELRKVEGIEETTSAIITDERTLPPKPAVRL